LGEHEDNEAPAADGVPSDLSGIPPVAEADEEEQEAEEDVCDSQ